MNANYTVFFSQLYYPDNATTAIIMTDLAEDLAAYGLNVKVLCAQPTYLVKKKSPKREVRNKVTIRRVWTFLFDKNKNLGRMLNSMSCFFSMLANVFTTEKAAVLVLNTNPAILPLLGLISKRFRNQRYVILVHDLWPELPAHTGMIRKGGLLYRVIDFIITLSLRYASGIIVLSNAMKKRVLHRVPGRINNIYVIHNWADANRVYPVAKENIQMINGLRLNNKKIVMYSGNLGRYQPLEVMIHTANELKSRKDILFLFVGNGGKKAKIQNMADSSLWIDFQNPCPWLMFL